MSRRLVPLVFFVTVVAMAGCTTSAPTATQTPTPTATTTQAPTATMTPTETATPTATTTSAPTTVPGGDDVPVVLSNVDDEGHTLRVSVTNDTTVLFNDTVTVDADADRTIATLHGPETTYRVQATMDGQSIDENVTLYPGFLESQIEINGSGSLEYTGLVN
ncbi:hypothetical protein [Halorhabdus salina]|uniref:hypothetical protein n=1 Tax=Halorhabdus salina TaxID=2750670 RepID=UPI0015EE68F9|nr:hypothetical protein [Halorhabdus salina]